MFRKKTKQQEHIEINRDSMEKLTEKSKIEMAYKIENEIQSVKNEINKYKTEVHADILNRILNNAKTGSGYCNYSFSHLVYFLSSISKNSLLDVKIYNINCDEKKLLRIWLLEEIEELKNLGFLTSIQQEENRTYLNIKWC